MVWFLNLPLGFFLLMYTLIIRALIVPFWVFLLPSYSRTSLECCYWDFMSYLNLSYLLVAFIMPFVTTSFVINNLSLTTIVREFCLLVKKALSSCISLRSWDFQLTFEQENMDKEAIEEGLKEKARHKSLESVRHTSHNSRFQAN